METQRREKQEREITSRLVRGRSEERVKISSRRLHTRFFSACWRRQTIFLPVSSARRKLTLTPHTRTHTHTHTLHTFTHTHTHTHTQIYTHTHIHTCPIHTSHAAHENIGLYLYVPHDKSTSSPLQHVLYLTTL